MLQFGHYLQSFSPDGAAQLIVARSPDGLRPYVLKAATRKRPAARLAAELLALRLAHRVGLPAPAAEPILFSAPMPRQVQALSAVEPEGELHLAIEYLGGAAGAVIDLPPAWLQRRRCDAPYRTLLAIFSSWLDARPAPRPVHYRRREPAYARAIRTSAAMGHKSQRAFSQAAKPHVPAMKYRLAMVGFGGCLASGTWKLRPLDLEQVPGYSEEPSVTEAAAQLGTLTPEGIFAELEMLPREWMLRVSPAAVAALPYELVRRARRLQLAEPARHRQPHL